MASSVGYQLSRSLLSTHHQITSIAKDVIIRYHLDRASLESIVEQFQKLDESVRSHGSELPAALLRKHGLFAKRLDWLSRWTPPEDDVKEECEQDLSAEDCWSIIDESLGIQSNPSRLVNQSSEAISQSLLALLDQLRHVHEPQILSQLLPFSGEVLKWKPFARLYVAKVLQNSSLDDLTKASFLVQKCEGPAKADAEALFASDMSAKQIFEEMEKCYFSLEKLSHAIVSETRSLPTVENPDDLPSLKLMKEKLGRISANFAANKSHMIGLSHLLIAEIASHFYETEARKIRTKSKSVQDVYERVCSLYSEADMNLLSFGNLSRVSPLPFASESTPKRCVQVSALKIASSCLFCHNRNHKTKSCDVNFPAPILRRILLNACVCIICFRTGHGFRSCYDASSIRCDKCNEAHPSILHECWSELVAELDGFRSKKSTPVSAGFSDVRQPEDRSRPVFDARCNGKSCQVLLDTGSDVTVVHPSLCVRDRLRPIPPLRISAYNQHEESVSQATTLVLVIKGCRVTFEAVLCPQIQSNEVIIGNDQMFKLAKQGDELSVETKFGFVPISSKERSSSQSVYFCGSIRVVKTKSSVCSTSKPIEKLKSEESSRIGVVQDQPLDAHEEHTEKFVSSTNDRLSHRPVVHHKRSVSAFRVSTAQCHQGVCPSRRGTFSSLSVRSSSEEICPLPGSFISSSVCPSSDNVGHCPGSSSSPSVRSSSEELCHLPRSFASFSVRSSSEEFCHLPRSFASSSVRSSSEELRHLSRSFASSSVPSSSDKVSHRPGSSRPSSVPSSSDKVRHRPGSSRPSSVPSSSDKVRHRPGSSCPSSVPSSSDKVRHRPGSSCPFSVPSSSDKVRHRPGSSCPSSVRSSRDKVSHRPGSFASSSVRSSSDNVCHRPGPFASSSVLSSSSKVSYRLETFSSFSARPSRVKSVIALDRLAYLAFVRQVAKFVTVINRSVHYFSVHPKTKFAIVGLFRSSLFQSFSRDVPRDWSFLGPEDEEFTCDP